MSEAEPGSGGFHEGQKVWIVGGDGSQRAATYVGDAEQSSWFGGRPRAYVVYADDQSGAAVPVELIVARDE